MRLSKILTVVLVGVGVYTVPTVAVSVLRTETDEALQAADTSGDSTAATASTGTSTHIAAHESTTWHVKRVKTSHSVKPASTIVIPKHDDDDKPTAAQATAIVDNLRTMFSLDTNATVADILERLAVSAEATAANKRSPEVDSEDGSTDNDEVEGANGMVYDLSSVDAVEKSLQQIAGAARRVAAQLRAQANDAVTAERWTEAEKLQTTFTALDTQGEALAARTPCSPNAVLALGKDDPCALPMLQQFARQQLTRLLAGDQLQKSGSGSGDISFQVWWCGLVQCRCGCLSLIHI